MSKKGQPPIQPEEVATVEAAVSRHPQAHNYRVELKKDWIVVLERTGPDETVIPALVERIAALRPVSPEQARAALSGPARYAPVLRLTLAGPAGTYLRPGYTWAGWRCSARWPACCTDSGWTAHPCALT